MKEITCPNCNVDGDEEELKRNNLVCTTCGFDLSDSKEEDDFEDEDDDEFDDEDEDEEEDDDEDEDEKE